MGEIESAESGLQAGATVYNPLVHSTVRIIRHDYVHGCKIAIACLPSR